MTVLIRTYEMVFEGKDISYCPTHYSLWERVVSFLKFTSLPAIRYSDRVTVAVQIQGPTGAFIDDEIRYRERYHLERLQKISPKARRRFTVLLCEGRITSDRPFKDLSCGQSPHYEIWMAGFYAFAPDGDVRDFESQDSRS